MTDVELEIESKLEDLEIKGCSEPVNFRKLLSREEKLSLIILTVEDFLTLGFLCKFKSSAKLGKEVFAYESRFQKAFIIAFIIAMNKILKIKQAHTEKQII